MKKEESKETDLAHGLRDSLNRQIVKNCNERRNRSLLVKSAMIESNVLSKEFSILIDFELCLQTREFDMLPSRKVKGQSR